MFYLHYYCLLAIYFFKLQTSFILLEISVSGKCILFNWKILFSNSEKTLPDSKNKNYLKTISRHEQWCHVCSYSLWQTRYTYVCMYFGWPRNATSKKAMILWRLQIIILPFHFVTDPDKDTSNDIATHIKPFLVS